MSEEEVAQNDVVDIGRYLVEFKRRRCHDVEVRLMSRREWAAVRLQD